MTRVVLCVQNLAVPSDPRVWAEARTLAEAGYDVTVVCPQMDGLARRERLEGVDIVRYPTVPERGGVVGQLLEAAFGLVGTAWAVSRLHRKEPIAVLHVANPPDTLFPLAWWLRRAGTKFVYDQHDPTSELLLVKFGHRPVLDWVLRWLERRTYAAADVVIAVNNSCRRLALNRSGKAPEQVVTVRLGPSASDRVIGPTDERVAEPIVAYAGVMGVQDTVEVLIDAFAEVLRRRPRAARLELIGRGDAVPALKQRVDALGITDAVSWAGWLSPSEMRARLRRATVGVSPDVDNAYTRIATMTKIAEYLSVGLPVIAADLPETRETASDAALYFRPADVDELADRLAHVLFTPSIRDDLAAAARARAPSLLWKHSAERLVAVYRQLLDGDSPLNGDQVVGLAPTQLAGAAP